MTRTLHLTNPLTRGNDVTHLQQQLALHGWLAASHVDGVYGPATAAAVLHAKHALGYPRDLILPVAGARLERFLAGAKLPVDYRLRAHAWQLEHAKRAKTETLRQKIVDAAKWGVTNEPQIHYRETRPMPLTRTLPLTTDCSGFVTLCYWLAGAPDPNRCKYNGTGYTGTLLQHGRQITRAQLQPADVVVYGAYPGHHTALVIEPGPDPLTISHGQEQGPFAIRVSDEARYQPAGITYLSFLN